MQTIRLKLTEIDPSKITAGGVRLNARGGKSVPLLYEGKILDIQFPKMTQPFGLTENRADAPTGTVGDLEAYTQQLSFRGYRADPEAPAGTPPDRPDLAIAHRVLTDIDTRIKQLAVEHAEKWFGDADMDMKMINKLYKSSIIPSKTRDPKTGISKPDGKWPDTYRVKHKINKKTGQINTKFYNTNREQLTSPITDVLTKGAECVILFRLRGLWFTSNFGYNGEVLQEVVKLPQAGYNNCVIETDDLGVEKDDDDEESVPAPAATASNAAAAATIVVEDDQDEEEEAEEEVKPVVAPARPSGKPSVPVSRSRAAAGRK